MAARTTAKNHENLTDAQVYWWSRQIAKYGLTPESWRQLWDSQGQQCAICGAKDNGKKRFHVDHDHTSGEVRGILCTTCNGGIGQLQDNPDIVFKAFVYLTRAVQSGDRLDHDIAVSVNPSATSQGNTEATRSGESVETTRDATPTDSAGQIISQRLELKI